MRFLNTGCAAIWLILIPGFAPGADPFAPGAGDEAPAPAITLLFEWIEVEHRDFHDLVSIRNLSLEGPELRSRIAGLIKARRADLIEAIAAHAVTGERGRAHSAEEFLYQTEYQYDKWNSIPTFEVAGKIVTEKDGVITLNVPSMAFALETRNVGFSVEYEPVLDPRTGRVDLNVHAGNVRFEGMRAWGEDESEMLVPDFHSMDVNTFSNLRPGRTRLLSTHRLPAPVNPARTDPRILLFVRAETREFAPARPVEKRIEQPEPADCGFLLEIIETGKVRFSQLIETGGQSIDATALRTTLLGDIAKGSATPVDTIVLNGALNSRFQAKSVLELIYPTEYDQAEIWNFGRITPAAPVALETRYVGNIFEIDRVSVDDRMITGKLEFEIVSHLGETEHGKAEQRMKMPVFHAQQIKTELSLVPGEASLLASFPPPNPVDPERKDPVWVAFVRGELIPPDSE